MKKEKIFTYINVFQYGPWTLEEFTELLKLKTQEVEKESEKIGDNFKVIKTCFQVIEDNKYGETEICLKVSFYREETDKEETDREALEKAISERMEKVKNEYKRRKEFKERKKKELENNPEYLKYKELEAELKKQKLI